MYVHTSTVGTKVKVDVECITHAVTCLVNLNRITFTVGSLVMQHRFRDLVQSGSMGGSSHASALI